MQEQDRQAIMRYLEFGLLPRTPIAALLQGYLKQALQHCTVVEQAQEVGEWLTFIWQELPDECWGSHERMLAWVCRTQEARMLYYERKKA